jgi:hypothetical protein
MDAYVNQLRYKQRQIDSQVQFLNQLGGAGGAALLALAVGAVVVSFAAIG